MSLLVSLPVWTTLPWTGILSRKTVSSKTKKFLGLAWPGGVRLMDNLEIVLANTQTPTNVDEAVDRLLVVVSAEDQAKIAQMSKSELIDLHFGLGLAVRYAFGLHDTESQLRLSCGTEHPDDASQIIIQALWKKVKESNF